MPFRPRYETMILHHVRESNWKDEDSAEKIAWYQQMCDHHDGGGWEIKSTVSTQVPGNGTIFVMFLQRIVGYDRI